MSWLINLVIGFIVRQLAKFGAGINWLVLKKDWDERLAKLIVWDALDEGAIIILNNAIDVVASIVSSADVLMEIVQLVEAKDFMGAIELLKKKMLEVIMPAALIGVDGVCDQDLCDALKSYKKVTE